MNGPKPVMLVYHFGPSTAHVGGMASVITMMTTYDLGADRTVSVPTWTPEGHLRSGWLAVKAVGRVLRMTPSNVIHVHMSEGGSFLREAAIVAAAKCRRLPCVITIHGPGFADFSARRSRLVASVLRMASAITVLSDLDLTAVLRLAPNVHAELLPNPMPLDLVAGPAVETSEIVLFAGEVGLRKGADVLYRAWQIVSSRRPLAKCIIVGPATEFQVPYAERLEVRGSVDSDQVKQLIREARVIALPSRSEALPMILTEAMAAGRPFVSTLLGGVSLIAGGGLIVPGDDHQALAEALIELLVDSEHAQSLGSVGQMICRRKMSPEAIDIRLRQLYTSTL